MYYIDFSTTGLKASVTGQEKVTATKPKSNPQYTGQNQTPNIQAKNMPLIHRPKSNP